MGLFNTIKGQYGKMDHAEAVEKYGRLLAEGESIELAYQLGLFALVFTGDRLISVTISGVKQNRYESIPYGFVVRWAVETPDVLGLNAELLIWGLGFAEPYRVPFTAAMDVYEVQAEIARRVRR